MNRRIKSLILFLSMVLITMSAPITLIAEASSNIIVVDLSAYNDEKSAIQKAVKELNNVVTGLCSYDKSSEILTINPVKMDGLANEDSYNTTVNTLVTKIANSSSLSTGCKNTISNGLTQLSGDTDYVVGLLDSNVSKELREAVGYWTFLAVYINPALGFLVFILIISVVVSFLLDLGYMVVAPFRIFIQGEKDKKPRGISQSAYKAVQEVEINGSDSNVILLWAKQLALDMFLVCLGIALMLRGEIFAVIGKIIDLMSGIF